MRRLREEPLVDEVSEDQKEKLANLDLLVNVEKGDLSDNVGREVKEEFLDLLDPRVTMAPLAHRAFKANKVSKVFLVLLDSLDHLGLLVTLERMGFLVSLEREEKLVQLEHLAHLGLLVSWDLPANPAILAHLVN